MMAVSDTTTYERAIEDSASVPLCIGSRFKAVSGPSVDRYGYESTARQMDSEKLGSKARRLGCHKATPLRIVSTATYPWRRNTANTYRYGVPAGLAIAHRKYA